jgi:hypothetical protein
MMVLPLDGRAICWPRRRSLSAGGTPAGFHPSTLIEMDGLMQERSYDSDTTSDEHRERTCSFLRGAGEEGERDALRRRAEQPGTERAGGGQQEQ